MRSSGQIRGRTGPLVALVQSGRWGGRHALKRRTGPLVALVQEGRQVEHLLHGRGDRRVVKLAVREGPIGAVEDGALLDPRGDEQGRDARAQAGEVERRRLAHEAVGVRDVGRRRDVVVQTAVLCSDQKAVARRVSGPATEGAAPLARRARGRYRRR